MKRHPINLMTLITIMGCLIFQHGNSLVLDYKKLNFVHHPVNATASDTFTNKFMADYLQ